MRTGRALGKGRISDFGFRGESRCGQKVSGKGIRSCEGLVDGVDVTFGPMPGFPCASIGNCRRV